METLNRIIHGVTWLVVIAIAAWCVYMGLTKGDRRQRDLDRLLKRETVVDTVVVYDTVVVAMPEAVAVIDRQEALKTLPVIRPEAIEPDSVCQLDSVTVGVPIETKVYQDSNYRAVITGAWASLDTLEIWPRVETVRIREWAKPPRWSVNVGMGYGWDGRRFSPFVGLTIGYNLIKL